MGLLGRELKVLLLGRLLLKPALLWAYIFDFKRLQALVDLLLWPLTSNFLVYATIDVGQKLCERALISLGPHSFQFLLCLLG